jgi:O-antigen ligase
MSEKLKKLANRSLLLIVFLLPLQTRYIYRLGLLNNGPWEYATIALYGLDILILLALLIALIIDFVDNKDNFKNKKYWLAILGLGIVSCLSLFLAGEKTIALYGLGKLAVGASLFWLVYTSALSGKKIISALLIMAAPQGALAFGQFSQQATPANKWLGLASHAPADLGASVVEITSPAGYSERWLRAYGSLDHPNMLGGFLAISLLMAIWLLINTEKKPHQRIQELALSLVIILGTAGLFFSFSRAAVLAFSLGLFILFITQLKKWPRLLLSLFLVAMVSGVLAYQYGYLYVSRAANIAVSNVDKRLEAKSLSERAEYLEQAKTLIKTHPLLGVGLGNFGVAVAQTINKNQISYYYQPVHNVFYLVASEAGLAGLLMFILLLGFLIIDALKIIRANSLPLALLGALIIIMAFDHWLWSLHFGILFYWLVLGLVFKMILDNKKIQ